MEINSIKENTAEEELKGIRGWLILVAIGIVYRPIKLLIDIILNIIPLLLLITDENFNTCIEVNHPLYLPMLIFIPISYVGLFIFCLVQVYSFFKKKKSFPKMIITFFIVHIVIIIIAILKSVTEGVPIFICISIIIINLIKYGAWFPYFIVSKRVKNTFIN